MKQNLDLTNLHLKILVINTTNTIQNPNRKIYLDITNKCQHMIKKKAKQTNKDKIYAYNSFKQFCFPFLDFLVPYKLKTHLFKCAFNLN